MSHIRSRKKLVQTAILTGQVATGTLMASPLLHAQEQNQTPPQQQTPTQQIETADVPVQTLETVAIIGRRTPIQQGFKVNKSANSKYVAPLLDTPKSVNVISSQIIQDTKATTLADTLRTSPGVTLGAGEGGNPNADRPFIRGFNAESSTYVDGVRSLGSQNREMFAIDSVEVTKGSASVLGGAGSTGGSINLVSKLPQNTDFVQGSVQHGTDNYKRIELDSNHVLGEGMAGRIAVMGHENDKAGAKDGAEYKRFGIAPSVTFGINTPNRATLSYYYLRSNDKPDSGIPYNNPFATTSPYAKFNGNGEPINVPKGTYYGWKDRDFQKQENQIGTLNLQHDFNSNLTLTNIASYSRSKNDYLWSQPDDSKGNFINKITGAVDGNVWRRINNRNTVTNNFSDQLFLKGAFNTGSFVHHFNTGVEYSKTKADRDQYLTDDKTTAGSAYNACPASALASGWCTPVLNPTQPAWTGHLNTYGSDRYRINSKQKGVYLLDNIKLSSKWLLDLGVRWDKFETDSTMTYGAYNATVLAKPPTHKAGDEFKLAHEDKFFNYQAGITFKPKSNGSIYLSYATSANPVGLDFGDGSEGISATNADLKPEEVKTLELGTKWNFLNNKLNLTGAIFNTDKTNTRVLNNTGITENIGRTRTKGVELTANGKLSDKWAISAGYTYLDGKQIDAGKSLINGVYTTSLATGKQIPQLAKNSASLWTTYQVLPKLTLGAGAFYSDKVFGNTTNTKWVPSYVRYDAMARYDIDKSVNLQLNVNNVGDKRYFSKAYASHYATEAEGRSTVLSLNFKY